MAAAAIALRSVHSLLQENFYVPGYQRGFRWTPSQVEDLLNDIWQFLSAADNQDRDVFYCLQPIVVWPCADGRWELVDGQQRLTTIYLILNQLRPLLTLLGVKPFSLSYETRPGSAAFLDAIDPQDYQDNIDFYHIYHADRAIASWFDQHEGAHKLKFLQCLLNTDQLGKNVRVIWYQLPPGEDRVQAFTRLNMGKIPLTSAELIRALFLRRANFPSATAHLQCAMIAQQWDEIEKALQDDALWCFLQTRGSAPPGRIALLFDLIARAAPRDSATERYRLASTAGDPLASFLYFLGRLADGDSVTDLWRAVRQQYLRLHDWFTDRTLYHLIGFLVQQGDDLLALQQLAQDQTRSAFRQALKQRILARLLARQLPAASDAGAMSQALEDYLRALDYENRADHAQIRAVLLLFNIAAILEDPAASQRFPFHHFQQQLWDIEHIRAIADRPPQRHEERAAWLRELTGYLQGQGGHLSLLASAGALLDALEAGEQRLSQALVEQFGAFYAAACTELDGDTGPLDEHDLGNLTLLDQGNNRGYGNAPFAVKRQQLIARDRQAVFIPMCTRNVFLKYFSARVDTMTRWTARDRADYLRAMRDSLVGLFQDTRADLP